MVKKIFALVMVVSILGVFLGGCGSKDEAAAGGADKGAAGADKTAGGDKAESK